MNKYKQELKYDKYFYSTNNNISTNKLSFKLFNIEYKIMKLNRQFQYFKGIRLLFVKLKIKRFTSKYHTIIWNKNIGHGFMIGHFGNILISKGAKLGNNISISNGVTIGWIKNGKNKGVPTIGNNVIINANSTVVGGIKIGDDVLIAPNTLVNFDVPSHSVVIGNPAIIKHKDEATSIHFGYKLTYEEFIDSLKKH